MAAYIKNRFPEFLVCVCMCLGIDMALISGWELTDMFSTSALLTAAVVFVLVVLFYVFAYSRVLVGVGVFAGLAVLAFTVFYMRIADPLADETANSMFIFFLVSTITCLLTFLLSRTKSGTIVALAIGVVISGGAKFLDFPLPTWAFVLFVVSSILMLFMRVCAKALMRAFTGMVGQWRYLAQSAGVLVLSAALACGVFFTVIAALNPPTRDLELITVLRSMETLEVFGLSETSKIFDPNLFSSGMLTDDNYGNDPGDEESEDQEGDSEDSESNDANEGGDEATNEQNDWVVNPELIQEFLAVTYEKLKSYWPFIVAGIVLAIVLSVVLKCRLRRRWHNRVAALPARDAVINYYQFFLRRLSRIGLGRARNCTLRDYSNLMEHPLQPFAVEGANFADLTETYTRVFYGDAAATPEDVSRFEGFYDAFYKNARRHLGRFKYILKFFRL